MTIKARLAKQLARESKLAWRYLDKCDNLCTRHKLANLPLMLRVGREKLSRGQMIVLKRAERRWGR